MLLVFVGYDLRIFALHASRDSLLKNPDEVLRVAVVPVSVEDCTRLILREWSSDCRRWAFMDFLMVFNSKLGSEYFLDGEMARFKSLKLPENPFLFLPTTRPGYI